MNSEWAKPSQRHTAMGDNTQCRKCSDFYLPVQFYGGDCDIFLGSLYINVGYSNAAATINPDIQGSLAYLGLSKITAVGLLHVSIGSSSNKHLDTLDFLPNLKVTPPKTCT